MAVNIDNAKKQADILESCASSLRRAARELDAYGDEVSLNWQGKESGYVLSAIDSIVEAIEKVSNELGSLSGELVPVATAVNKEEAAAKLRQLKAVYDTICEKLREKEAERQELAAKRESMEEAEFQRMNELCRLETARLKGEQAKAKNKLDVANKG